MVIVHSDLIAVALKKQELIGGLRYVSIPEEFGLLEEFGRRGSSEGVRLSQASGWKSAEGVRLSPKFD